MSILAQQNINRLNAKEAGAAGGTAGKWVRNLGRNSGFGPTGMHAGTGWGGFSYTPGGLSSLILSLRWRQGPQGKYIFGNGEEHQYGPKEFSRLSDSQPDLEQLPRYSSILTSFAFMVGSKETPEWAPARAAQNMRQSFTSGEQTKSLWNRKLGPNRGRTPVASGGSFRGYQAGHEYGVTNWDTAGKSSDIFYADTEGKHKGVTVATATAQILGADLGSSSNIYGASTHDEWISAWTAERTFTSIETEKIRSPLSNINHTGLRNIPGMMGPN